MQGKKVNFLMFICVIVTNNFCDYISVPLEIKT